MLHSIKGKQTIGLFLTLLITASILIITVNRYEVMIDSYETLTDNISFVQEIMAITDEVTNDVIKIYSGYDLEKVNDIELGLSHIQQSIRLLKEKIVSDQSLYILRRLINGIDSFKDDARQVNSYMEVDNITLASEYRDAVTIANESINRIGQDLVTSELETMQVVRNRLVTEVRQWKMQVLILCLLLTIIVGLVLWKLNSSIYINVNKLITLFRELGKGNLEFQSPNIETKDEFKVLMDEAENMKESLKDLKEEKELSKSALVTAIGSIAEMRDKDTGLHIHSIQCYLRIVCNELMNMNAFKDILTTDYVENLIQLAPLHDIGKIGIPDMILMKPAKLTFDEFEIMKKHVNYGAEVIHQACIIYNRSDTSYFDLAEQVISEHHEKWNGSGYPKGLKGEEISLAGRLIAIVDVYDALTTDRIYKKAYTHDKAMTIIKEGRGRHFDPYLVDVLLKVQESFSKELFIK